MARSYPLHTCSASRIWWSCAVLKIAPLYLYLFDLGPWTSKLARPSKLLDVGFWSCPTRPVELNPCPIFHLLLRLVFVFTFMFTSASTLSICPTSACSLFSLESFNLPFSDFLDSCLPIIIDFGFRYGVFPLAQTPYWL